MPFNGSGLFQRVYNWVNDANANINITASRVDTEDNGFATGLSNCLCKDGQQNPTANLPMATYRHTGVGAGVGLTDYARMDQLQNSAPMLLGTIAGTDAITAVSSPVLTAYAAGQTFRFIAANTNATTTPTLNIGALGAKTIQKKQAALVAGDITAGDMVEVTYDGTYFQMLSPTVPTTISGNAGTATKLATARTIAITGDLAYTSTSFDGSANVTAGGTLATVNSNIGSFTNASVTVNAKGLITAASNGVTGLTLGTPAATTSGTSISLSTTIPSTAKQITVNFKGVGTNSTSSLLIQIGPSGGVVSTGYVGGTSNGSSNLSVTTGFGLYRNGAQTISGSVIISLENSSNNTWVASGVGNNSNPILYYTGGYVALSGLLTQLSLTTIAGTDTFNAGEVNISYQ